MKMLPAALIYAGLANCVRSILRWLQQRGNYVSSQRFPQANFQTHLPVFAGLIMSPDRAQGPTPRLVLRNPSTQTQVGPNPLPPCVL